MKNKLALVVLSLISVFFAQAMKQNVTPNDASPSEESYLYHHLYDNDVKQASPLAQPAKIEPLSKVNELTSLIPKMVKKTEINILQQDIQNIHLKEQQIAKNELLLLSGLGFISGGWVALVALVFCM